MDIILHNIFVFTRTIGVAAMSLLVASLGFGGLLHFTSASMSFEAQETFGGIVSIVRDSNGEPIVLALPMRFDALVDAMVPEGKASLLGDESQATVIPARRISTRAR